MPSESYSAIHVRTSGRVLEVTLNRPDVRNALDETLIGELTRCLSRAAEQCSRALVIRGAGPAFCAGADFHWLKRAADFSFGENIEDARDLQRMFQAIAGFPGVTVAIVHGDAIGFGAGIAAACDVAIADAASVFALSDVRLGLVPAIVAPYIVDKIGSGATRGLFVTGTRFDAQKALRIGLIEHIGTGKQECDAILQGVLADVLGAGPEAVKAAKHLIADIVGKSADEAAEITALCVANLRGSAEGQEGIRAFLEKRMPSFAEPGSEDEDLGE